MKKNKIKSRNLLRSFAVCSAYRQITMVIEQFATLKTKEIENSSEHTTASKRVAQKQHV